MRRNSLLPSHTTGSYFLSATRSFIGINALSVILMCSGADLGAALGDVAEAEAVFFFLGHIATVEGVQRMHRQLSLPHQVAGGACEGLLVLLVVTVDVAHVLAQEALDALAELLAAVHVLLLHPVLAGLQILRGGSERRDLPRLLVVEGHVGDQVAHHGGECPQRGGDRDDLVLAERRHPGHAHQSRPAVDLGRTRTALAGLAVPPHREVTGLGGLQAVDDVEHDLALVDLDRVVLQVAAVFVAAPDPQFRVVGSHSQPFRSGCSAS